MPQSGIQSKVITIEEISDYLRVHPSTIYRLVKRGKLPGFKVGSDWRFNLESIDKWRLEMEHNARGRSETPLASN